MKFLFSQRIEVNVNASFNMHYCNECDKSFTTKFDLIRHHSDIHANEASFKSSLKSLGYSTDMRESHSNDDEYESRLDTDEEMDEDSVVSTSESDEDDDDDIEDNLNDEDASTPSLYPLRNAWAMIEEDAESCYDGDVVSAYIDQVRVGRQLKTDPVHMKVMETMQSLQRRDSNMDFEEALVKAANRRKHIIEQAAIDAKQEEKDAKTSEKESN